MDRATLAAYDGAAAAFAKEWHEQPAPSDLHTLVKRFFRAGPTADIGCGGGRDVAWLCANGFPTVGYDASEELLAQARTMYPGCQFDIAVLPELRGLGPGVFENVLCETVIMHLQRDALAPAVRRLFSLLAPGGTLYLTWRVTEGSDWRDAHGRLYSAFHRDLVTHALSAATILLDEEVISASSGKKINRIIARAAHPADHGMAGG
jgi:SAM-dependent methyltransferase